MQVAIRGQGMPLDKEFEQALSPPEVPGRAALRNAWGMLALQGRLNFEAVVIDRPDQPQDIDVAVDIRGCTMKPEFFRYAMSDVSAGVRYAHGRVYVKDASAKHGRGGCGLKEADDRVETRRRLSRLDQGYPRHTPRPGRGVSTRPASGHAQGVGAVAAPKTRSMWKPRSVLDAPTVQGQAMKIWWDGGASLHDQVFQAGVEIKGVEGVIWCHGHHNGQHFEGVSGNAILEQANILGQPFRNLKGRIEIAPDSPDVLRLYDLKAEIFGGFIGGEARFQFASGLRYEVKIDALQRATRTVRQAQPRWGRHANAGTGSGFAALDRERAPT